MCSIHLHTQVYRFTLLASQSYSAHWNLWFALCNSRLVHLAEMLCLHINSSQRSRSKLFQCLLITCRDMNIIMCLRYLFFGYIELASDGLCHLQSALRTRKHGSEAVESLNKKTAQNTTLSTDILTQVTMNLILSSLCFTGSFWPSATMSLEKHRLYQGHRENL